MSKYISTDVGCEVLHVLELAAAGDAAADIPGLAEAEVEGLPGGREEAQEALLWLMRTADGVLGEVVRGGRDVPYRLVPVLVAGFEAWRSRREVVAERVGEEVMA